MWAGFFNNGDPNSLRRENVSLLCLSLLMLLLLLLALSLVCYPKFCVSPLVCSFLIRSLFCVFACVVCVQPPWPRYQAADSQSYYFTTEGAGNRVVSNFNKDMCDFWDTQGYGF